MPLGSRALHFIEVEVRDPALVGEVLRRYDECCDRAAGAVFVSLAESAVRSGMVQEPLRAVRFGHYARLLDRGAPFIVEPTRSSLGRASRSGADRGRAPGGVRWAAEIPTGNVRRERPWARSIGSA